MVTVHGMGRGGGRLIAILTSSCGHVNGLSLYIRPNSKVCQNNTLQTSANQTNTTVCGIIFGLTSVFVLFVRCEQTNYEPAADITVFPLGE